MQGSRLKRTLKSQIDFSENFPGAEHSMSLKMTMHVSDSGHIPEGFENLLLPSPDR